MSLRQATPLPFAYKDSQKIPSAGGVGLITYEFDRTVYLHSLSVYSNDVVNLTIKIAFPTSFTQGGSSNLITLFSGQISFSGLHMTPGAISSSAVGPTSAYAPLPSALPKGSIIEIAGTFHMADVTIEAFVIASGV